MPRNIMIVDDDPSIQETVKIILDANGYPISIAKSGRECIDMLRDGFRGLLFMDVMMPEMDGWDTIAAIEKEDLLEGNIICMLTAVNDPGPKMESIIECVIEYVRKPFTSEELLETVREYLPYVEEVQGAT